MKRCAAIRYFFFIAMTLSAFAASAAANDSRAQEHKEFSNTIDDPRYKGLPTYLIEMKDGQLIPDELVVPEKARFRLLVRNVGGKPAEFESNQLRQEKVLFMGAEVSLVIIPLDTGTYDYFDDFAPGVTGTIIVTAVEE